MMFFYDGDFVWGQAEKVFRGLFLALNYRDFIGCQAVNLVNHLINLVLHFLYLGFP
jgi:hypothetical protein